ncbi:MAG: acetate/propionate family kinase [Elusimicrobia bacterium]|nr:acetate/propionate family kinase [Elusimicrobiota bacterium]
MAVLSQPERIVVVNAGTSSLKLRVLAPDDGVLASADPPPVGTPEADAALERFLRQADRIGAVGHRVVHGGPDLRESVVVTEDVVRRLRAVEDLAPLHIPPALAALEAARRVLPGVPHVVCFDTAFHATIPEEAAIYAIPREWTERWRIRRYGFHGLSHSYVARRTAELLRRRLEDLRTVTCHLGSGASLAAVRGGRSVDTTMGFTPDEGLVMATRSGSVDPGMLLWLQRHAGISPAELEDALTRRSGVLGISGVSSDMREVLAAADAGDRSARLAVGIYVHHLRQGIAAMAASMGGLHAVAFAGGVGEGAARVRRETCAGLEHLGIQLDLAHNERVGADDSDLSAEGSPVRTLVVHTREDVEIAREVRGLLRPVETGSSFATVPSRGVG